jgi:hypothetical protein
MFWLLLVLLWLVATVCLLTGSWATWHVLKIRHRCSRPSQSAAAQSCHMVSLRLFYFTS